MMLLLQIPMICDMPRTFKIKNKLAAIVVCCMDVHVILLTPKLKMSKLKYKAKASIHLFTLSNLPRKDVFGYVCLLYISFELKRQ